METGKGQWRLRLTPHVPAADDESLLAHVLIGAIGILRQIMRSPLWRGPSRAAPFQRADDEPEQEEGDAAELDG
jgi:hypothetical protein